MAIGDAMLRRSGKAATIGYQFVKDEILRRIRNKKWSPGSLIPGEIELSGEFGVARGTVNRAMRELTEQGYLVRKRKGGTRVRPSPLRAARFEIPLVKSEVEKTGADYGYRLLRRRQARLPAAIQSLFGLPGQSRCIHLECLHLADGEAFQLEERWISLASLPQAAKTDFTTSGPNEWLVQTVPYTDVEIAFEARGASDLAAKCFGVRRSEAMFTMLRTTWAGDRPITHVRITFHKGYRMATRY